MAYQKEVLFSVLIRRDELTEEEALERIKTAVDLMASGEDLKEALEHEFDLPDYVFDLLEY